MKNKMKLLMIILAAFFVVATLPVMSAQARLDEMLLRNAPYTSAAADLGYTGPVLYRVEKGDSLWKIAQKYGLGMKELAAVNNLSLNEVLRVGQVLTVPGKHQVYRVKKGDTLWNIAKKFNVSIISIARQNGLEDVNVLRAGQRLVIPQFGRAYAMSGWPARGGRIINLAWPLRGRITSLFGMRNGRPHEGLDIAASVGTPIRAARPGRVTFTGSMGTYGLTVIVNHGAGLTTRYAHCSRILVSKGEWVETGQAIARVGNTGRSTGPHLHFEVRLNGIACDPLPFLRVYA